MSKKKALIKETVIRRWGKLANIQPLTENWLEGTELYKEQDDEEEMDLDAEVEADPMGDEMPGAEEEVGEPVPGEEEAVERIVSAVVDAISSETGVEIEVEGEAGGEEEMAPDEEALPGPEAEMEMGGEEEEEAPARRGPYNRKDDKKKTPANRDDEDEEVDEALNLEVLDDEELTEAVLKRVVERLLRRRRK